MAGRMLSLMKYQQLQTVCRGTAARNLHCGSSVRCASPAAVGGGTTKVDPGIAREAAEGVKDTDTTMLGWEEIKAAQIPTKPPGEHPGVFMHQQGELSTEKGLFQRLFKNQLVPVYPLFAMVGVAFVAAGWHIGHQMMRNPAVELRKERRGELHELEEPQKAEESGKRYLEDSGLRKLTHQTRDLPIVREVDQTNAKLPKDTKPRGNFIG